MCVIEGNSRQAGKNGTILEFWEVGVCPLEKREREAGQCETRPPKTTCMGEAERAGICTETSGHKRVIIVMWN